jgi:hypothetical protein
MNFTRSVMYTSGLPCRSTEQLRAFARKTLRTNHEKNISWS